MHKKKRSPFALIGREFLLSSLVLAVPTLAVLNPVFELNKLELKMFFSHFNSTIFDLLQLNASFKIDFQIGQRDSTQ